MDSEPWLSSRMANAGYRLTGFRDLREALPKEVRAEQIILDGELVVTDHLGRSIFAEMLARKKQVRFLAFDLLHIDGEDLRQLPLIHRKLKKLLPSRSPHILYVDHTRESGTELYHLICQLDLEGIVAKKADSSYDDNPKSRKWIKTKNPQ